MANICSNSLEFTGDIDTVNKAVKMFEELAAKQACNEGSIPDIEKRFDNGWFFHISITEGVIYYDTKWSPNIDVVTEIAKHFNLNYTMRYEELGCGIYGKAIYTAGNEEAEELDLTNEDLDQYEEDEENDCYIFNGKTYESRYDIFDILFKNRFGVEY